MKFINVLLPVATGGIYTYSSETGIPKGMRVSVPFGKRVAVGIVLGEAPKPAFECRDIISSVDETPLFPPLWLDFIDKISKYYAASLGTTLHGIISSKIISSEPPKEGYRAEHVKVEPLTLNEEQTEIIDNISIDTYAAHLLYGITSSGKTEIYLELIKKVIKNGKKAIYLVPEISLTPQLVDRIASRLGIKPSLFHSKLGDKKRNEAFWHFAQGEASVLIGPRSALFVPTYKPGIIIIDEEHETTYKQEESPSYQLRDMAVLYASLWNIPVVLGSATPQVESIANAKTGKYHLHHLKSRAQGATLPTLDLIDLKTNPVVGGIMAEPMYDELCKTVNTGNQAILFLNRKGYATSLYCRKCGDLQECVNCSVPLTLYKNGRLICHYCGTEYNEHECSGCKSEDIISLGIGTERVEEFIEQMFPGNCLRLDADKITSFQKLDNILKDFYDKKAQILIGTQLIAKGLHFPDVTFVGILGIDNILSLPDFRSSERAYQLITQVSGRAGRGVSKGAVHIQTFMPDNPIFQHITGAPEAFYDFELNKRVEFHYPPYTKLSRLIFSYSKEDTLTNTAEKVVAQLRKNFPQAQILGPAKSLVYRIKNNYRLSVLIKSNSNKYMINILNSVRTDFEKEKTGTMMMKIDRDPYFFM